MLSGATLSPRADLCRLCLAARAGGALQTQRTDAVAGPGRGAGVFPAAGAGRQRHPDRWQPGRQFLQAVPTQVAGGPVCRCSGLAVLALGVRKFWARCRSTTGAPVSGPAATEALDDVLRLKYPRRRPWRGLQQRRRRLDAGAGAFTTLRSTASCCALRPPRCITMSWTGQRPTPC